MSTAKTTVLLSNGRSFDVDGIDDTTTDASLSRMYAEADNGWAMTRAVHQAIMNGVPLLNNDEWVCLFPAHVVAVATEAL